MPQELLGMLKVRVPLTVISGPPRGPFGLRVSTTRQGVTGMNCSSCAAISGARAIRIRTKVEKNAYPMVNFLIRIGLSLLKGMLFAVLRPLDFRSAWADNPQCAAAAHLWT